MRLFVAVAIPDEVAGELEGAVAPLRAAWPGLRWTRREAWHLTLAFLGEVNEAVVARLTPRLERAATRHSSLTLALGGAGTFPGAARARVLWTGVHGDRRALSALAASVAAGARRAGAPPAEEGRRFQPHLTLARCRAPVDARDLVGGLADYTGSPWTAQEIYLICSHLPGRQEGAAADPAQRQPRHETLASWPLGVAAVPAPEP